MTRERDVVMAHTIHNEVAARIKRVSALGRLGTPHHPHVLVELARLSARLAEARLLLMVGPEMMQ